MNTCQTHKPTDTRISYRRVCIIFATTYTSPRCDIRKPEAWGGLWGRYARTCCLLVASYIHLASRCARAGRVELSFYFNVIPLFARAPACFAHVDARVSFDVNLIVVSSGSAPWDIRTRSSTHRWDDEVVTREERARHRLFSPGELTRPNERRGARDLYFVALPGFRAAESFVPLYTLANLCEARIRCGLFSFSTACVTVFIPGSLRY